MFLEYILKLSETNTRARCSIVQIAIKLRDKLNDVAPQFFIVTYLTEPSTNIFCDSDFVNNDRFQI